MDMEKTVNSYAEVFRRELAKRNYPDTDGIIERYKKRLEKMYLSEAFKMHNVYPTTHAERVYAVIAICLEMRESVSSFTVDEAVDFAESAFESRRKAVRILGKVLNQLPNSFEIAKKWNISDHAKRVSDGSVTYDYFNVSEDRVEYSASKCMYVEMFSFYGIREYCKIFCMTDEFAYSLLTKHVDFIWHSNLSDGDSCCAEVIR
ncbi:MAG: L-2-amino-thiazoline-4-carboxylic acid hydrolase, partial [Ruminococcus sp.]|nr:L-2-amino-thiazoline-4-carboxylic acid hydrolase [Ruminococcus sp.]